MKNVTFEYNGISFAVCYINGQVQIYKLEHDNYVELNVEEQKLINKLLNEQYSYIYNSDSLKSLIEQNDKMENKDYLYSFLSWLEQVIPVDCRENLYRNIKTLGTDLNVNFTDEADVSSGYSNVGGYNTLNNTLIIDKTSLGQLRKIANMTNAPDDFYWRGYSQTLLHELSHMASSHYNSDTSISLCGFDIYPPKKNEDQNRGLTEGFTEIISMAGVPGTVEMSSGYYTEALFINQLINIIGNEDLIKAYFSNLGISPLKERLQELIPDKEKSFELFRNIELNFQIRNTNENQDVLGAVQSTLLDYFQKKVEKMYDSGEYEQIANAFNSYEHFLVTPEKLTMMQKNPNNYMGLQSSLEKFAQLKNMYAGFGMEDDNHKTR